MSVDGFIKTSLKDQVIEADEERGSRSWRSAELAADDWFLVERCTERCGEMEVRRWISTSVRECGRLLGQPGAQWSKLLAYVRLPHSTGVGFMFGEVADLHELGADGARVLRFTSGMTVMLGRRADNGDALARHAEQMTPVYSKSPFCPSQVLGRRDV